MPDGSSSAAPVMSPGPSLRIQSRIVFHITHVLRRWRGEYNPRHSVKRRHQAGARHNRKKARVERALKWGRVSHPPKALGKQAVVVGTDIPVLGLGEEYRADDERHDRNHDRIPQAV